MGVGCRIKDKANISNPKVNRGCPPLTANRISADSCANFTLTLNTIYSTEGLPYSGFQRYSLGAGIQAAGEMKAKKYVYSGSGVKWTACSAYETGYRGSFF